MTEAERISIERACERLVTLFHIYADRFDHDALLGLYADDAVVDHIYVGKIEGREAIKSYLARKETTSITRHITTNIVIDVIDESHAKGKSYWTFYASAPGSTPPVLLKGPMAVGDYDDEFVRTKDGWRFSYRRSSGIFGAPHASDYVLFKA